MVVYPTNLENGSLVVLLTENAHIVIVEFDDHVDITIHKDGESFVTVPIYGKLLKPELVTNIET